MHELSLVQSLLEMVDRICREHSAAVVTAVHVEVGPLAGVEPALLVSAFERLAARRYQDPIEFRMDEIPLQGCCDSCQARSEIVDYVFRCAYCDSTAMRVVDGDKLQLVSVALRTGGPVAEAN